MHFQRKKNCTSECPWWSNMVINLIKFQLLSIHLFSIWCDKGEVFKKHFCYILQYNSCLKEKHRVIECGAERAFFAHGGLFLLTADRQRSCRWGCLGHIVLRRSEASLLLQEKQLTVCLPKLRPRLSEDTGFQTMGFHHQERERVPILQWFSAESSGDINSTWFFSLMSYN